MRVRDANQPVASYLGREGGSLGEERLPTIRAAHEMLERNLHCSSPHRTKAGPPPVRGGAPGGAVRTRTPRKSALGADPDARHRASSDPQHRPFRRSRSPLIQTTTVTRKKVAGMEVASLLELLFWLSNRASSSFCSSAARPFFSAAANAFIVGP